MAVALGDEVVKLVRSSVLVKPANVRDTVSGDVFPVHEVHDDFLGSLEVITAILRVPDLDEGLGQVRGEVHGVDDEELWLIVAVASGLEDNL